MPLDDQTHCYQSLSTRFSSLKSLFPLSSFSRENIPQKNFEWTDKYTIPRYTFIYFLTDLTLTYEM